MTSSDYALSRRQAVAKRSVDVCVSVVGLTVLSPLMIAAWVIARRDTGGSGFFRQERIGRHGNTFEIVKLRTMRVGIPGTSVTTDDNVRITPWGRRFRRYRIDELPQLWNVLRGDMSLVGPRPDVPGFADRLCGDDRLILELRPGITGPAALKWRHESAILATVDDPELYNRTVIYPDKVALNLLYLEQQSFGYDLRLVARTLTGRG